MSVTATCAGCEAELEYHSGADPAACPPCPRCEGRDRNVTVTPEPARLKWESFAPLVVTGRGATPPGLLVQAAISFERETDEGQIIRVVSPLWRRLACILDEDPLALHKMDPRSVEHLVAATYAAAGFDGVTLTPQNGDFGRDVIAVKRGYCTIRVIDSVKRFAPGNPVTANDVRALLGVLATDPRATKGIVTTTSTFAPRIGSDPSIAPFIPYKLELVNGEQLTQQGLRIKSHPNYRQGVDQVKW